MENILIKRPIFVVSTPSYYPTSGGCVVLYKLSEKIKSFGYQCYCCTAGWPCPPEEATCPYPVEVLEGPKELLDDRHIVIYPEVMLGNPLGAKNVVRWLLFTTNNDSTWASSDLVFKWCELYTNPRTELVRGELCVLTFEEDLNTFKDLSLPRSGQCYIVRKGSYKEQDKHDPSARLITSDETKEELQRIFNEHEEFISYDFSTYYSVMAALTGCRSIVIPEESIDKESWRRNAPMYSYGIAYGFDDLEHAEKTKLLLREYLYSLQKTHDASILKFIETCTQEFYGEG